ncbi:hypothetical protein L210DRAFT_3505393 [Boletus edulis BED1]|uniref:Uncharacterized protein n=1 Tax=Boletus edulis BED1 TaxID=1328754 RepID=A0AAD4GDD5_BOLED|nr:hypothetical protein L210DRAFT_3505393 [Boletus edulis BED1]
MSQRVQPYGPYQHSGAYHNSTTTFGMRLSQEDSEGRRRRGSRLEEDSSEDSQSTATSITTVSRPGSTSDSNIILSNTSNILESLNAFRVENASFQLEMHKRLDQTSARLDLTARAEDVISLRNSTEILVRQVADLRNEVNQKDPRFWQPPSRS